MTNFDLIVSAAIGNKLYTKEEAEAIITEYGELPVHTFAEWKSRGYSVKKGEKAKFSTKIWKFKKENVKLPMKNSDGEEVEQESNSYYLVNAYFFTKEQVEKIKEKGGAA